MLKDIQERCNAIEECYEFTLSYAARGLSTEAGSDEGRQLRDYMSRASAAMSGLAEICSAAIRSGVLTPTAPYQAFTAVLARDAESSLAAMQLVLAQPIISAQLIDNLNASIHLRALLTDLFLISDIAETLLTRANTTVQH